MQLRRWFSHSLIHSTKSLRDSPLRGKGGSENSGVGNQSSEQR